MLTLAPGDVLQHLGGRALQRVAPAAAARRPDPDDGAGPQRLGVGQRVDLVLVRAARIDGDRKRLGRLCRR
jgi:hypothetical protein